LTDEEQLRERFIEYRNNPVQFVREVIGADPTKQQQAMLWAIAKPGAKVSIKSGHGCGKSCGLAWLVIWFLVCFQGKTRIPCTAPSSHQLMDVLWPEIVTWIDNMHPWFKDQIEYSSDKIWIKGSKAERYAVARTARPEKPEALQGFHAPNLLFIIDESSGVAESIFEVSEGTLSEDNARVIMTSNPTRTEGYFYRSQTKDRKHWTCLHFSCLDSPLVGEKYPTQMAEKYGKDSSRYKVRVLGEFPDSSDDILVPLHLVENAIDRDVEYPTSTRIAGLDVARKGDDATAIVIRQGNKIIYMDRWYNKDLAQTIGKVTHLYKHEKLFDRIHVDAIGMGAGVADVLRESFGVPTTSVNVAETSAYSEKFQRLRDELWWSCREFFERADCCIPSDLKWIDELITELTSVTYDFNPQTGKLKVASKDEIKKLIDGSPNMADALNLTLYKGRHPHLNRVKMRDFKVSNPEGWT